MHFKGEVVNAACAVDAGSIDQTVQLGQVRSAKLATAGSTSSAVGFNIQLDDCDTTVATKASVAFAGTAIDSSNTTVLALQNSAAGSATTSACRSSTIPVRHWHWTRHLQCCDHAE
ncbi:type 1 fimbriae major subunit FimA [Klebsiella pneumoniae]|uniref:Type 1 fimbriae major subunit FimA n=1 Tax=Klebsiella pneumoniae TaxID=573 RepID=A0A378FNV9_KLEPN|nr:type 1 fimbriae major subunit FimA [Klebsiella pneumoniae]